MLLGTRVFKYLFRFLLSILLGVYLKVKLLNHMLISRFNFFEELPNYCPYGYTILHSYQQGTRVPISPYPYQHLFYIYIYIHKSPSILLTILKGVKWHLIVVLIFTFLITSDIEYLFMCLLAICIFSLEKYLQAL